MGLYVQYSNMFQNINTYWKGQILYHEGLLAINNIFSFKGKSYSLFLEEKWKEKKICCWKWKVL